MFVFNKKEPLTGLAVKVLIDRLRKRRIPEQIMCWIKSFCDNRKATISVNGESSAISSLSQAGLPQGSPLLPILLVLQLQPGGENY